MEGERKAADHVSKYISANEDLLVAIWIHIGILKANFTIFGTCGTTLSLSAGLDGENLVKAKNEAGIVLCAPIRQ